jgi:hypothetical protein
VLAAPLYSAVQVSDVGTGNTLAEPNGSRMVAVSPAGTVYVAYHGADGIRVARSTDGGQSFQASIQITATNAAVSVAVDYDGIVYVAFVTGDEAYLSRSDDEGLTFSAPSSVGAASATGVDIATDAPYVYILTSDGQTLFVNDAAGVGAFTTVTTGLPNLAFSGLLIDPLTRDLFAIGDMMTLYFVKSTDHGATFGSPTSPPGSVLFSTYIGAFGSIGQKAYVAGASSGAVLVDLQTGAGSARTFGNNVPSNSRTLAVDGAGNVVDGYSNGSDVLLAVSNDQGQTFGAPVTVATGSTRMELALIFTINDIVAAYEQGGQIFVNVYRGLLPRPPTLSATADQTISVNGATGSLAVTVADPDGDPVTVTLSGASSNTALVPDANITFGGSGAARTVTVTPAAGVTGSAVITVRATNSIGLQTSDRFLVTVTAGIASQTISFTAPADTTYGAAPVALSAAATSGLPVSFSSLTSGVCTVSGSTAVIVAAGTCTIAANQAGNGSFNPAPQVQDSFTVAKAALAVTARNQTRMVGQANLALTYMATGFVSGETAAVFTGTLATTATPASVPGDYQITQGSLAAANYTLSFTGGTLTVTPAAIVKIFLPIFMSDGPGGIPHP